MGLLVFAGDAVTASAALAEATAAFQRGVASAGGSEAKKHFRIAAEQFEELRQHG